MYVFSSYECNERHSKIQIIKTKTCNTMYSVYDTTMDKVPLVRTLSKKWSLYVRNLKVLTRIVEIG